MYRLSTFLVGGGSNVVYCGPGGISRASFVGLDKQKMLRKDKEW
jgi:hypothetical protein